MIDYENLLIALRHRKNKKIYENVKPWLVDNRVFYAQDWGEDGRELLERCIEDQKDATFGLPFNVMSFESDNYLSKIGYEGNDDALYCKMLLCIIKEPGPFDIPQAPVILAKKEKEKQIRKASPMEILALCIYEDDGTGYGFVAHLTDQGVSMPQFCSDEKPDKDDEELKQQTWQVVNQAFFNCSIKLNDRNFVRASESVRKKIKTGSGKNKSYVKINEVIRLLPKKDMGKAKAKFGREITGPTAGRFGHWRKLPNGGIGRDQAGKRVVKGYTWIKSFEKGDPEKPLVKKIRVLPKGE